MFLQYSLYVLLLFHLLINFFIILFPFSNLLSFILFEPFGLRRFPMNEKAQIFLFSTAKVRTFMTSNKYFCELFALTVCFLTCIKVSV